MVSPRRSGRTTSTPAERTTRSHHKLSPRQKSLSPSHVSDDNPDAQPGPRLALDDPPQTRRSTRAHVHDDDEVDQSGNVIEPDDEVTRCVCGLQDYPGPPLTDDLPAVLDASQAEDAGGLFIQCDRCHVWQHGGCVGIMDESKSPENYFCEQCDKKLHRVMTDPRGQRYSRYLPLYRPEPKSARKPSITKDSDSSKGRKEREDASRASVESSTGKRRSTMNSRQAYDDEETLRRVIEESKGENDPASTSTVRKGKRSRDDSEESKHEIKRQRTGSDSPNPPSTLHTASQAAESDDDTPTTKANKKLRGTVAETLRQREAREREVVRNQKRAEAAGRRSERAGRRRGEDSEPAEDMPTLDATPAAPTSRPPSPAASAPPQAPGSSHKKGAGKRQKRLGRNQYSAPKPAASPNRANSQPAPQPAHASSGDDPSNSTNESKNSPSSTNDAAAPAPAPPPVPKPKPGKWGRGKNARQAAHPDTDTGSGNNNSKDREKGSAMSLLDMKKRTSLMMEYIAKAQVDMAGERTPLGGGGGGGGGAAQPQEEGFKELSSREMMDVLTRRIMNWQKDYGGEGGALTV